jgi:hypothetical protein
VKPSRCLIWFAFALCAPSLALADDTLVDWAKRRVQDGLVTPLAKLEEGRSRFSRGRPAPRERRVRVTQGSATNDARGRAFVPYAIDVRFGSGEWVKDDLVGCAYRETGELFVKNGDEYRPAAYALGTDVPAVEGVCVAGAPPPRA